MAKSAMARTGLLRAGGLALLSGSIAYVAYLVLRSLATSGSDPIAVARAAFWVPLNALGLVGAMLVLFGMPAIFARVVDSGGRAGAIGWVLLAASWAFFGLFLSQYGLLVLPWLAEQAPSLVAPGAPLPVGFMVTFMVGLLSWVAGAVLAGIPFIRHRAGPPWIGYVMVASALALVVGNLVIAPSGPVANLALNLLSNSGPILLLVAVGYLGFRSWSDAPERTRRA